MQNVLRKHTLITFLKIFKRMVFLSFINNITKSQALFFILRYRVFFSVVSFVLSLSLWLVPLALLIVLFDSFLFVVFPSLFLLSLNLSFCLAFAIHADDTIFLHLLKENSVLRECVL